jgi:hypothetical protein
MCVNEQKTEGRLWDRISAVTRLIVAYKAFVAYLSFLGPEIRVTKLP